MENDPPIESTPPLEGHSLPGVGPVLSRSCGARLGARGAIVSARTEGRGWWIDDDGFLRLTEQEVEDCGSCGCYHPRGYSGDCRDDHYRLEMTDDGTGDFISVTRHRPDARLDAGEVQS